MTINPLVPINPATRPAEVERRLDDLERATRTPGVGVAAGDAFGVVTPVVSGTFQDPTGIIPYGPYLSVQVPPSNRLVVMMSMTVQLNITADATPIVVTVEGTVESTSGSVIGASSNNGMVRKVTTIANQPLVEEITLSRQVLFSDLDAVVTALKMSYRTATTNAGKTVATVSKRTLVAVPQ